MGIFSKLEKGLFVTPSNNPGLEFYRQQRDNSLDDLLNSTSVSDITSRDDIINPDSILSEYEFGNSAAERKRYEEVRNALLEIQKQQDASYQEWYESPLQQVKREKLAGLNPDIIGLQGSQAAEPGVGSESPLSQIPNNADRFAAITSGIVSLVSSVANVASLPVQFANTDLIKAQASSLKLSTIAQFQDLVVSEISSRLSDDIASALSSGQSLDINEWFGNESNFANILETYSPDSSPHYASSFANVRKRLQTNLGKAYEQGKVTNENRSSFAAMAADPTYSSDLIIQIAQLRPYMEARRDLEIAKNKYEESLAKWQKQYQDALDVRSAVDAANEQNDYTAEYYRNIDAEKLAIYDTYIKEAQSISSRMQKAIDNNFLTIYEQNHDNIKGISAAYLYSGGASKSWYEYLIGSEIMYDLRGEVNNTSVNSSWNGVEVPSTNPADFTGASPSPSGIRGFMYPGSVGF